jgi:hypothetical protein
MAKGGHGLPKVLLGPAMSYLSIPCRYPPLKQPYSLTAVSGMAAGMAGSLRPPSTPFDTHTIRLWNDGKHEIERIILNLKSYNIIATLFQITLQVDTT